MVLRAVRAQHATSVIMEGSNSSLMAQPAALIALGAAVGAGVAYAFLVESGPSEEYPEFETLDTVQISSPAAAATAKNDGAANRAKLEKSGVMGKSWP